MKFEVGDKVKKKEGGTCIIIGIDITSEIPYLVVPENKEFKITKGAKLYCEKIDKRIKIIDKEEEPYEEWCYERELEPIPNKKNKFNYYEV